MDGSIDSYGWLLVNIQMDGWLWIVIDGWTVVDGCGWWILAIVMDGY